VSSSVRRWDWRESRDAFTAGARAFVEIAALVGDRWGEPGLGAWDVRALVGHTSRALLTVEEYLGRPAPAAEVDTAVGYYLATRGMAAGAAVEERGRAAGDALGEHPAEAVAAIAERVLALVGGCDGSELVTTIAGGMRLADYLPTRTFELVVHSQDLASALGEQAAVPEEAARQALGLAAELAVAGGDASEVLLALTGRRALPEGFSVL
jgi:hypothetical protein